MISSLIHGIKEWLMIRQLKPGDVIRFYRDACEHWTIYIGMVEGGERSVIHWWTNDNTTPPRMRIDPFRTVADSLFPEKKEISAVGINMNHTNDVVQRARAFKDRVDTLQDAGNNYNDLFRNSKHFVDWCLRELGRIDIELENIRTVWDPRRFVHGRVTNTYMLDSDTIYQNFMLLNILEPGDVIRYFSQDYEHWAMYVGLLTDIPSVIHWCDKDSVQLPNINIENFDVVAGHCKAEIDWNDVHANNAKAVLLAQQFQNIVERFPAVAQQFKDSRTFAFWCRFGLGADDLTNLPPLENAAEVNNFVNERMLISDPINITRQHNNRIQTMLEPGDVITFSQNPHKRFAVCVETEPQGSASLIWWTEIDDPESRIRIDWFETIAEDKKAMIYTDRVNLNLAINWNQMIENARALQQRVNESTEDCTGLFSNSMHFANWVFDKYGPHNVRITMPTPNEDLWQHIYEFRQSTRTPEENARIRQTVKTVLGTLSEGDIVKFHRTFLYGVSYDHCAVYIGRYEKSERPPTMRPPIYPMSNMHNEANKNLGSAVQGALSVIHWWSGPTAHVSIMPDRVWIRTDSFWTVAWYDETRIGNDPNRENRYIDGHTVVENAKRRKKEFERRYRKSMKREKYHVMINNCEHFANECRYGTYTSSQSEQLKTAIGLECFNFLALSLHVLPLLYMYCCNIIQSLRRYETRRMKET